MNNALFQNWYAFTDGIETVSVAGSVTDADVQAFRTLPTQPEISGGQVGVDSYDLLWIVDAGTVASELIPGDTITDSDTLVWTVLNVRTDSIGATAIRYNCQCRKNIVTT